MSKIWIYETDKSVELIIQCIGKLKITKVTKVYVLECTDRVNARIFAEDTFHSEEKAEGLFKSVSPALSISPHTPVH